MPSSPRSTSNARSKGGSSRRIELCILVAAAAIAYERYDTKTLKRTLRRDAVYCGVNSGLPGFSAKDDKGNVENWAVELVGINDLVRRGWGRNRVAVGDVINVDGYGAKNGKNIANAAPALVVSSVNARV